LVIIIIILDQLLKIWVKTHMSLGEEFAILPFNKGYIHFVENEGMAFGISLGGSYGKLILSVFRIGLAGLIIYYINWLIKQKVKTSVLITFSLILAGAIGNIIDSAVYGLIFSESPYHGGIASMFPPQGGYGSFLHGKVVDMFYFPLLEGVFPSWVPIWGGEPFVFFRPVFNIADASISIGIVSFFLFQKNIVEEGQLRKTEDKVDNDSKKDYTEET
jgi:signal peptidase II